MVSDSPKECLFFTISIGLWIDIVIFYHVKTCQDMKKFFIYLWSNKTTDHSLISWNSLKNVLYFFLCEHICQLLDWTMTLFIADFTAQLIIKTFHLNSQTPQSFPWSLFSSIHLEWAPIKLNILFKKTEVKTQNKRTSSIYNFTEKHFWSSKYY
jgi:hypothetical protein